MTTRVCVCGGLRFSGVQSKTNGLLVAESRWVHASPASKHHEHGLEDTPLKRVRTGDSGHTRVTVEPTLLIT
jgi:hypothetical protein